MIEINKMIVALYKREQISMKDSTNPMRLFIAKALICLMIWIWLLPVLTLVERMLIIKPLTTMIPRGQIVNFIILILIYIPVNYFTWKLDDVQNFLSDDGNLLRIIRAKRLFFVLLIAGFILLNIVAFYNKFNPVINPL